MTLHRRDCAPCDAAVKITDELAALWDPNNNWTEHPAIASPEMTLWEEVANLAAEILHRYPLGGSTRRVDPRRLDQRGPA
ncbi:hypothetical protein [Amycolatopsis thermoflava]|uniref:hypothetical protein n=1 Tax=Amycolatopsis thermoflava TaxID=84480 RepID=UPI000409C75C|nr:hypothetical protein [Amycolatopsis thermoflava]